jgi:hypothetical protein
LCDGQKSLVVITKDRGWTASVEVLSLTEPSFVAPPASREFAKREWHAFPRVIMKYLASTLISKYNESKKGQRKIDKTNVKFKIQPLDYKKCT